MPPRPSRHQFLTAREHLPYIEGAGSRVSMTLPVSSVGEKLAPACPTRSGLFSCPIFLDSALSDTKARATALIDCLVGGLTSLEVQRPERDIKGHKARLRSTVLILFCG